MRVRDCALATLVRLPFGSLAELREIVADTPWQLRHVNEHEESYAVRLDYQ